MKEKQADEVTNTPFLSGFLVWGRSGLSQQGAELMAKYGVRVPPGIACATPEEVNAAAAKLSGESGEVVVKSQVREKPTLRPPPPPTPHLQNHPPGDNIVRNTFSWCNDV